MSSAKITRKTIDDSISYEVLETPGFIEFTNVDTIDVHEFEDGYRFIHTYIPTADVKRLGLPMDANPREPSKVTVVNKMIETIKYNPDLFHHWNNGINIVCKKLSYNNSSKVLQVSFDVGDGICNGGHTYFAIVTYPREIDNECKVHLEFICLPETLEGADRKKAINDIAGMRNKNRELLATSNADYQGYYNIFKECLSDLRKYVIWHEGDSQAHSDAIRSDHFVRLLASLDPFWFKHPSLKKSQSLPNHKQAASGLASIHSKWFDAASNEDPEGNLSHVAFISRELMDLRDRVSFSLCEDDWTDVPGNLRNTNFYRWLSDRKRELHIGPHAGSKGLALPGTFEVNLIGTFRYNIWLGLDEKGVPKYIGFLQSNSKLWNENRSNLLDRMKAQYQGFGDDNAAYNRAESSFNEQLISIAFGRNIPKHPEYFYSIDEGLGKVYQYERKSPTHYLKIAENSFVDFEVIRGPVPEGSFTYVERENA